MKRCSQCTRTYSDETLSFCLEDGSLLSAPYNPQETNAPTFVLNSVDIPTVQANEVPTVFAERAEIPTVVNSPRPNGQTKFASVGWKIYLAGLIVSIISYYIFYFQLFSFYLSATPDIYNNIAQSFENDTTGRLIAGIVLINFYNAVYHALLGLLLGFIWSRAGWKWGFIAIIAGVVVTISFLIQNLSNGNFFPIHYVRAFFETLLNFAIACFFSHIGSRLSEKIFNKHAA